MCYVYTYFLRCYCCFGMRVFIYFNILSQSGGSNSKGVRQSVASTMLYKYRASDAHKHTDDYNIYLSIQKTSLTSVDKTKCLCVSDMHVAPLLGCMRKCVCSLMMNTTCIHRFCMTSYNLNNGKIFKWHKYIALSISFHLFWQHNGKIVAAKHCCCSSSLAFPLTFFSFIRLMETKMKLCILVPIY